MHQGGLRVQRHSFIHIRLKNFDKKTVTHPGTNRAWCRVTTVIKPNMLLLS